MTDHPTPPPVTEGTVTPSRWWHRIHFHHDMLRRSVIRLGYWSSIAFMALIAVTPWLPEIVYPHQQMIGFVYLVTQFAEINAADHLHNKEVLWDHLLSLFPALLGAIMIALLWKSDAFVSPASWIALKWWTAYAWFDFAAGIVINNTILNAPYQRQEQH